MRLHSIRIEGRDEIAWPPRNLLQTLIHSLSAQNGPTFVVLTGPNDQYVQAAGSADRYILESRDTYGEGFQHLRAGRLGSLSGDSTTVFYRWKCTEGVHPPLGCPLKVDERCVLPIEESLELVRVSGLPDGALVEVGTDHRLAELEPLEALAGAVEVGQDHSG